ncbi:hypothetical protein [Desulfofustis glycolicus]|uniref:Uncharacterized protein n=1 Tax=Desulfofustis glycolicus DSM 9705 TaxID=1121409 RepID=A0A1M5X351_9BACT|nr:hypothetical protein [Desulfofustis glycolicus]MCB2215585.1 hypothetical protein [Desulfobulbaceae bacterium]SHH94012.1 hypothetical protein SAMN02745124_02709 [Desulfofustis glycolicus DSM 9705]
MKTQTQTSLPRRLTAFAISLCALLSFVYGVLPLLTDSVDVLDRMSILLEDNNIDPSRYYYTDVQQVEQGEQYLETVLADR